MPLASEYLPAHTVTPARSGASDAPVVLIGSSIGTASDLWAREIEALAEVATVIAYEHPGHGAAVAAVPAAVPAGDGPYTVEALSGALVRLLDRYEVGAAHVVGLSLGGVVAQGLALTAPERVASLTLVCTAAVLPPRTLWETRAAGVREAGTVATPVVSANLPDRWLTAGYRAAHPAAERALLAGLAAVHAESYAGCCEALADWDAVDRIAGITAPTLVVAGALDPVTPVAAAVVLRDGIPGARLEVVTSSHLAPIEVDLSGLLLAHVMRAC